MATIKLNNVGFLFPKRGRQAEHRVLHDLNLYIPSGQIALVVGPNGCGKSTLLSLMNGDLRPTKGHVNIDGIPAHKVRVATVYQHFSDSLLNSRTVLGNVVFPLEISEVDQKERVQKAMALINKTPLRGLENRYMYELSGGQRQLVAICRALIPNDIEVMLMDEPFSQLHPDTIRQMLALIEQVVRSRSLTLVIVMHQADYVTRIADHTIRLGEEGTQCEQSHRETWDGEKCP